MPSDLVKKISSTGHLSSDEIEKRWETIKHDLVRQGKTEKDPDFYRHLVGRLKRSLTPDHRQALGWSVKRKQRKNESLSSRLFSLLHEEEAITLEPDEWRHLPPQLQDIEHLEALFAEQHPSLLRQLRSAMDKREYLFLLKKMGQGAFWAAALVASPYIIGTGLAWRWFQRRKDLEREREKFFR